MGDVFVEYMITRRQTPKILMQKMLLSLAAVMVSLLPLFISALINFDITMMMPLSIIGSGWGMIIFFRRLNLEFEYIVTNGEMDVDKIMGRRTRKRLLTVDCRSFDILAPCRPDYSSEYESQTISSVIDVSSHSGAPGRWFAVFNAKDGSRTLLIFEPNEKMLDAFRKYIRSKIKE